MENHAEVAKASAACALDLYSGRDGASLGPILKGISSFSRLLPQGRQRDSCALSNLPAQILIFQFNPVVHPRLVILSNHTILLVRPYNSPCPNGHPRVARCAGGRCDFPFSRRTGGKSWSRQVWRLVSGSRSRKSSARRRSACSRESCSTPSPNTKRSSKRTPTT